MQRQARSWHEHALTIGFVPTMGYLHLGHTRLMEVARKAVGKQGQLVVSSFVNPTQFGPGEDFAVYPRDLRHDIDRCRAAGVDVLFVPSNEQMYPGRGSEASSTFVVEEALSRGMEGASRPTHFRGVTTVVAKLFQIVQPDVAVFGQKDFQQAAVVKRMVRDLHFPIKLIVAPTVREADGLALSSRNQFLSSEERRQAAVLWEALQMARRTVRGARRGVPTRKLRAQVAELVARFPAAQLDYAAFFEPQTLEPAETVARGAHMALAVFIGKTRLIDNAAL